MGDEAALADCTVRTMRLAQAILSDGGPCRDFSPEDALVDVGLSSLDLVNLMLAVEADFDIMIPPSQLTPENFRSVASIARMVAAVLTAA